MKHLCVSMAIIAMLVSCGTAQAFNPYESEFQALQDQIDELQDRIDETEGYTDEVRYHKQMQYYMVKPLCPDEDIPGEWFCSHPDKRPGKIDITYSPWTLANLYGNTRIDFSGPAVTGMVAYVTAVNMSGSFAMITWDERIQWVNPADRQALFMNESRVYRFIWTVVPNGESGYSSAISGKVISRNFRP